MTDRTVADLQRERWLKALCFELNIGIDGDHAYQPEEIDALSDRKETLWMYDHEVIARTIIMDIVRIQPRDRLRFIRQELRSAITRGFGFNRRKRRIPSA